LLVLCSAAVYDVTRRETLESLSGSWMAELESYQPHPHVARMVVANKVDAVRRFEGRRGTIVLNLCVVCVSIASVARMVVANKVDAVRREVDGLPLPAKVPRRAANVNVSHMAFSEVPCVVDAAGASTDAVNVAEASNMCCKLHTAAFAAAAAAAADLAA
jgi:hypothetical protein